MPDSTLTNPSPSAGKRLRKHLITLFKIAIAVLAIWYVVKGVNWNDSVIFAANGPEFSTLTFTHDTEVILVDKHEENGKIKFEVRFPGTPIEVRAKDKQGNDQTFKIVFADGAVIPGTGEKLRIQREMPAYEGLLKPVAPGQYVHDGLRSLLIRASRNWHLVLFAWILLGIPFFVTAIRWRNLMRPQGIEMPLGKCLQLTFVGQFYSIILPGITGGDLVKIVYAARLTGSKTKSFITIILDRVIGLISLMVIAGTSAGVQLILDARSPVAGPLAAESHKTLLNVFILIVALLACMAVGITVYFSRRLRKLIGIEWFIENFGKLNRMDAPIAEHAHLEHLFRVLNGLILAGALLGIGALCVLRWAMHSGWAMKNTPAVIIGIVILGLAALAAAAGLVLHNLLVKKATPLMGKLVQAIIGIDETLHVYRGHFGLLLWAFLISVISQLTLPLSAWLSGTAFGMNAPVTHYMAYVPLAVLAASLPISPPQGAGFLEWVLDHFFVAKGEATASQAFALTQSVRFLPILWNLFGAYWVITGKYSRKTEPEA